MDEHIIPFLSKKESNQKPFWRRSRTLEQREKKKNDLLLIQNPSPRKISRRNARYARPLRARHLHTDDRALERRRLHIFARRVCERSAGGEAGSTPVYFSISRLFPFKW